MNKSDHPTAPPELCGLCKQPMPEGEEMFNYHGYSGPCPERKCEECGKPTQADDIGFDFDDGRIACKACTKKTEDDWEVDKAMLKAEGFDPDCCDFIERHLTPPATPGPGYAGDKHISFDEMASFAAEQLSTAIDKFIADVEIELIDESTGIAEGGGIILSEIFKAMRSVAEEMKRK